jgi:hypothetical protein
VIGTVGTGTALELPAKAENIGGAIQGGEP